MKIAIPTANGELAMHFGHCQKFSVVEVENDKIVNIEEVTPPPHEPGVLPKWLREQGANVIIAGGMGKRAQELFKINDIVVNVGAPSAPITELVEAYLAGELVCGENVCDH